VYRDFTECQSFEPQYVIHYLFRYSGAANNNNRGASEELSIELVASRASLADHACIISLVSFTLSENSIGQHNKPYEETTVFKNDTYICPVHGPICTNIKQDLLTTSCLKSCC